MKIPSFYEYRWKRTIKCRADYEDSKKKRDYLRLEYELWALWIDKFYSGKYGIYKTLDGDAPRYVLEYDLDFCLFENTYKKNYPKKDHFKNHKVRSQYIIKILTNIFNKVDNYVLHSSEDDDFNLDFEEMKIKMMNDPTYKEKWFKAAYDANSYIEQLLSQKNILIPEKDQNYNIIFRKKRSNSRVYRKKRSKSKTKTHRKRQQRNH